MYIATHNKIKYHLQIGSWQSITCNSKYCQSLNIEHVLDLIFGSGQISSNITLVLVPQSLILFFLALGNGRYSMVSIAI